MFALRIAVYLGVGAGLLALGYYVGREVGRLQPIREQLRHARKVETDPH